VILLGKEHNFKFFVLKTRFLGKLDRVIQSFVNLLI